MPGAEVVGEIIAVGEGIEHPFEIGVRVLALLPAGAVGSLLVQRTKIEGAKVFAGASSIQNYESAKANMQIS